MTPFGLRFGSQMASICYQNGDLKHTLVLDTFLAILGSLLTPRMELKAAIFLLFWRTLAPVSPNRPQDRPEDPQRPSQGPPKRNFLIKLDTMWCPEASILTTLDIYSGTSDPNAKNIQKPFQEPPVTKRPAPKSGGGGVALRTSIRPPMGPGVLDEPHPPNPSQKPYQKPYQILTTKILTKSRAFALARPRPASAVGPACRARLKQRPHFSALFSGPFSEPFFEPF